MGTSVGAEYGAELEVEAGAVVEAEPEVEPVPDSLKGKALAPVIERLSGLPLEPHFVTNKEVAIQLGKALFWDIQAGSDGQSCASCHFHAGADSRAKNQLNPGKNGGFDLTRTFEGGPNYTLKAADFPFHVKDNPDDRDSGVVFDTDDVASSQGVAARTFNDIVQGQLAENCSAIIPDPLGFHVNQVNTLRVEGRNTPTP